MDVRVSGPRGKVRHSYQLAASLGAWTLVPAGEEGGHRLFALEAEVLSTQTYWIRERPLDVDLTIGGRTWTWGGVEVGIGGARLTATLVGIPAIGPG